MKTEKVTIIGAGPAGIAAAIQLKRWGVEPLLLEKDHIGGLLVNASLVENYPGFPHGIPGLELARFFESQLAVVGVTVTFEEVLELDCTEHFIVKTPEREFTSRIVIIASGTRPKMFDEFEIPKDAADRIFYEVRPLIDQTGKKLAIIGSGDAAFDYALNLSRKNEVIIINRSAKTKCLPLLRERSQKLAKITYVENARISSMKRSPKGIALSCQIAQGDWELEVDYVIFAIGREPQNDFLSTRLKKQATELENRGILYFAGDVKNDIYRQTSIAVGDGVRAAMRICRILEETG